jgi:tetratricopeptide (TPR) repeat protein
MMADKPDDGIRTLQEYMAESCGTISADAHIFLANALAGRKRLKEALPQIDLALSKAKAPKETWMQLKLAVHYELKDYKSCAQTLVQLISMVPDKSDYWKQLSSMFYEMKKDHESLAVLAVAERQGFLNKPHEYRNLYSIYMMLELPYKAGTMLQAAVDAGQVPADETNLESIANAWINAREPDRAEKSLKTLASISERGEYFFKLGAMYGDEERWKESKEVLAKALQKGGIKRTGEAWMRLAVAEYNLKNEPATYDALRKALNYDEIRKQAGEWLRHLTGQLAADDKAPATQDSAAVNRDSSVASSS